jgi:three-Cys-motif partner protein
LPCRVSGDWAKEKLYYLEKYIAIVSNGMKNKWPGRTFIDLMAGPGRCITNRGEFPGSPILALRAEPPFSNVILVEEEAKLIDALRLRTEQWADRREIVDGDCNDPRIIERIRSITPATHLAMVFVDNLGLDVTFETLKRLTQNRQMDLVITLQVSDLVRNTGQVLRGSQDAARFDRFFGSPDWRTVVAEFERHKRPEHDLPTALTSFYLERLATVRYTSAAQLHVLMKNDQNAPLYRLILAGKHPKAAEFFRKIARIEYSGQRGFRFDS